MNAAQRDEILQYIDNKGGPVPSVISNALADMDGPIARMTDGPDRDKARKAFNTILEANLVLGTSPGEEIKKPGVILWLRQKLLALPIDAEPAPPAPTPTPIVVVPNGSFVGIVYKSGTGPASNPNGAIKWKAGTDMIYRLKAGSNGPFSFTAGSGGVECTVGRQANLSDGRTQTGTSPEMFVAIDDEIYVRFHGGEVTPSQDLTASIPR